ncbi:MAG: SCO family protein, partial [Rhodoferax sp.]|nr:SCO family protein [Rhodoferax sp.]
ELLKAYMANFDPSFVALRGDDVQTTAIAKDFKIYFKKVDGQTPTSYTMDHSAGSYIFDPAGRLRVYSRYGSGPEAVAADVRTLLKEAA